MNKRKLPLQQLSSPSQHDKKQQPLDEHNDAAAFEKTPTTTDIHSIRGFAPTELRDYYQHLLRQESIEIITPQLLKAVEDGLLPPRVFATLLAVSKAPAIIREALKQNVSVLIRQNGIHQLAKNLRSANWRKTWDGVGGVDGILDVFSDLSVGEMKKICKIIGRLAVGDELVEKRACVTELFQALHPSFFPDSRYKTADTRPLENCYQSLLPSCSPEMFEQAIVGNVRGMAHFENRPFLLQFHFEIVRQVQLQSLEGGYSKDILRSLLRHYPTTTSSERDFSASMDFSLTVLRRLVELDTNNVDDDFVLTDLIRPLLVRAVRKHVSTAKLKEIVDLTTKYVTTHPAAGKKITNDNSDIVHLVARCWSRTPEIFEEQLRILCSCLVNNPAVRYIDSWQHFLREIPLPKRYSLLRIAIQETTGLDLHVDSDLKMVKGSLQPEMLQNLDKKQALSLFSRLRSMKGDEGLVAQGYTSYYSTPAPTFNGHDGDPELCYIALQNHNGNYAEAEKLAELYIEQRKKKSQSAPQPEQRGFHAKSVLWAAVASGSLDLLQAAIKWSKRFMRDPLVVKSLYNLPIRTARLLSGVPEAMEILESPSDLHRRVEKGNSVLADLFDIACSALQEPSFNCSDWSGVINSFYDVVTERISLSSKVKTMHEMPDDEVFRVLWEPTIQMLISIETKANQEGHERLRITEAEGILGYGTYENRKRKSDEASTINFLDKLALARDTLWRDLRRQSHPAVTSLPIAFPRGLSIQALTAPWTLDIQNLGTSAPYLASRVQSSLFPDPSVALQAVPLDRESQNAIGGFVDNYRHALQLYASESCDESERKRREQEVWDYAIGPLSKSRMDNEEAHLFWSRQNVDNWPPPGSAPDRPIWPVIPEVEDPTEPTEWNPLSREHPDRPARKLGELTYIDLSLRATSTYFAVRYGSRMETQEVPADELDEASIWDQSNEGSALAAMLYLDTKYRCHG